MVKKNFFVFIQQFFYIDNNLEKSIKFTQTGFRTAIIITSFNLILFLMLTLMKLDNILLHYFTYGHFLIFPFMFFCLYGMKKILPYTFIIFFCLFILDKVLLISYELITPLIGFPIVILMSIFLFQGIKGSLSLKKYLTRNKKDDLENLEKEKYNNINNILKMQKKRNIKGFKEAILSVIIILLIALVIDKIVIWYEKSENFQLNYWLLWLVKVVFTISLSFLIQYKALKQLIGKMHLAIVNFIAIAIATLLSTFIVQHGTIPYEKLEFYPKSFGIYLSEIFFFLIFTKYFIVGGILLYSYF